MKARLRMDISGTLNLERITLGVFHDAHAGHDSVDDGADATAAAGQELGDAQARVAQVEAIDAEVTQEKSEKKGGALRFLRDADGRFALERQTLDIFADAHAGHDGVNERPDAATPEGHEFEDTPRGVAQVKVIDAEMAEERGKEVGYRLALGADGAGRGKGGLRGLSHGGLLSVNTGMVR